MTGRRWWWLAALAAVAVAVAGVVVLRTGDPPDAPSRQRIQVREGGTVRVAAIQEPSGFNPTPPRTLRRCRGCARHRWPLTGQFQVAGG